MSHRKTLLTEQHSCIFIKRTTASRHWRIFTNRAAVSKAHNNSNPAKVFAAACPGLLPAANAYPSHLKASDLRFWRNRRE
jgi:hypothetical protein